jgi:hypothetical protein
VSLSDALVLYGDVIETVLVVVTVVWFWLNKIK